MLDTKVLRDWLSRPRRDPGTCSLTDAPNVPYNVAHVVNTRPTGYLNFEGFRNEGLVVNETEHLCKGKKSTKMVGLVLSLEK